MYVCVFVVFQIFVLNILQRLYHYLNHPLLASWWWLWINGWGKCARFTKFTCVPLDSTRITNNKRVSYNSWHHIFLFFFFLHFYSLFLSLSLFACLLLLINTSWTVFFLKFYTQILTWVKTFIGWVFNLNNSFARLWLYMTGKIIHVVNSEIKQSYIHSQNVCPIGFVSSSVVKLDLDLQYRQKIIYTLKPVRVRLTITRLLK